MVTLFSLKGNRLLVVSLIPPKNKGVFLDQSMPLPLAVSTPDSINLTAMLILSIGTSKASTNAIILEKFSFISEIMAMFETPPVEEDVIIGVKLCTFP